MPRPLALILLCLALTACAPTNAPSELVALGNVRNTATAEAVSTQAAAQPVTQSYLESEYAKSLTEAALPAQRTREYQEAQLRDIEITKAWDNATATAAYRVTEAVEFAVMRETAIPATGTALAVAVRLEAADARKAEALSNLAYALGGLAGLAALVLLFIGGYWLFGRAQADVKKSNVAADNNRPRFHGDTIVYPSPNGTGYLVHRVIRAPAPMVALAPPPAIEERPIPINGNGAGTLRFSQPVNEHEKLWRECLAATLFHARERDSFASTELAGSGKLFSSNDHWQRVTDVLRDNDLILKDNGGKTVRAGEWSDIISRVQDATKPLKLPARIPPRLRVLEGQKVY